MVYTLSQAEYKKRKTALTRAINGAAKVKDNPSEYHVALLKIEAVCYSAARLFCEQGFPDNWHRWNIAFEDANGELTRLPSPWRRVRPVANPFDN